MNIKEEIYGLVKAQFGATNGFPTFTEERVSCAIDQTISVLMREMAKIKGGYVYSGAASYQVCFPLKAGGELRVSIVDEGEDAVVIDLYDGSFPPGMSGPVKPTG